MDYKEMIEILKINQGCAYLDWQNGDLSRNTIDFIQACELAIEAMELLRSNTFIASIANSQEIKMGIEELTGNAFRVIGRKDGTWVECLVSGSMISVEHKDFRMLTHREGAVHYDAVVETERLLSRV